MNRDYEQAARQYQKAIEIDPKRATPHWGLAGVYIQTGQFDLAKRESRTVTELLGDRAGALLGRAYVDAFIGKRGETLEALKRLKELSIHEPVSPFNLAHVYTALGDKDHALALLVKAYDSRDPKFDSLRSDVRFQDLVHRTGL